MMAGALMIPANSFVERDVQDSSNNACSSGPTIILAPEFVDGGVEEAPIDVCPSLATMICGGGYVEGVEDSCDDSCSICLENFCEINPSTITNCNHEYHLHCILEWSQRGKECPMCWQALSLKDPGSQALLVASQQQRFTHGLRSSPFHQTSSRDESQVLGFGSYGGDVRFEDRSISGRARGPRSWNRGAIDSSSTRHLSSLERQEEIQQGRSPDPSLSEKLTFKSRLAAASFKYRDSFSKTTRGLRERLRLHNHGAIVDLGSRDSEMSAGVL